jgi:basic amino acid/polyamine antiporter, APA family
VLANPAAHDLAIPPPRAGDFTLQTVSTAAALTLWAMLGIEVATVPAEKVSNPGRTIPLATLTGASAAGLLYLLVCSAIVLMLPVAVTAGSAAPFADFADRFIGGDSGALIAAFGAISAIGAMNGWLMVQGELPCAMARDGLFPAMFARCNSAGTPWVSHLVSSSLLSTVVLLNYSRSMADLFQFLILLTGAIVLVMYLATALAAGRLATTGRLAAGPGLWAIILIGIAYAFWTFYGAGLEAVAWGTALIAAGVPAYLLLKRSAVPAPNPVAPAQ